jgi:hypothetical protein
MLVAAFKWLAIQLIVISALIAVCGLLVWLFQGREDALQLIENAVVRMKGPWVWTFGYGMAYFIMDRGPILANSLNGVLVPDDVTATAVTRIERSCRHRNAFRFTIPITLLGVFLTYVYGIPSRGLAYALSFLGVCAIYYIGGFLLFHLIEVVLAFQILFDAMDEVDFKRVYSPLHLENLTTYLAITTILGLIGIYAGFRGTVTAGFQFQREVWRVFLITPIVLFVPGTLFYDYYPRYVLRKLLQHKVFRVMERLGASGSDSDTLDTRSLLLDLRETAASNSQILPFVDYKTLPSYLIAILFVISLAYNNDPAVKTFFDYLSNFGAK